MLRFESEPACPSKLLIARCYSTIRARIRPNGFERILAHRINCQRATASLSSRVASKQLCNYRGSRPKCQHPETNYFRISTVRGGGTVSGSECVSCVLPKNPPRLKIAARFPHHPRGYGRGELEIQDMLPKSW